MGFQVILQKTTSILVLCAAVYLNLNNMIGHSTPTSPANILYSLQHILLPGCAAPLYVSLSTFPSEATKPEVHRQHILLPNARAGARGTALPCAQGPSRAASSMLPKEREANKRTTSWIRHSRTSPRTCLTCCLALRLGLTRFYAL